MARKNVETEESSGMVAVAKTLGKTAGKIVALAGVHATAPAKAAGKLPKKNKSRLPRRQKKALHKAGGAPMM
jgi:hypothetical protein